jgi:hypothetical protein
MVPTPSQVIGIIEPSGQVICLGFSSGPFMHLVKYVFIGCTTILVWKIISIENSSIVPPLTVGLSISNAIGIDCSLSFLRTGLSMKRILLARDDENKAI